MTMRQKCQVSVRKMIIKYRQTCLRPRALPPGGDSYYHDILSRQGRTMRLYFQNEEYLPSEGAILAESIRKLGAFNA